MRAPRVLPCAVDAPQSEGFVLVGVVIFVMALTILGLSVFSLSSYEAQFMRQAMQEQQAYNDAMSGFERAKYMLTVSPYRLESVQSNLPAGVDSTIAWQAGNTAGPVSWGGQVMLRVRASRGNSTQAYVAWFVPELREDQYKRLITSSSGMRDPLASLGIPRRHDSLNRTDVPERGRLAELSRPFVAAGAWRLHRVVRFDSVTTPDVVQLHRRRKRARGASRAHDASGVTRSCLEMTPGPGTSGVLHHASARLGVQLLRLWSPVDPQQSQDQGEG